MKRIVSFAVSVLLMVSGHARDLSIAGGGVAAPAVAMQAQAERASTASATMSAPNALVGDQALADLNRWYGDTRSHCGNASAPAFLCTGIMLRATQTSAAFLPWNPNPSSTGTSFSWLRSDVNFRDLVYTYWNGFIFYPKNEATTGANVINVLCVFPMDADTNSRPTLEGCGPATQVPATSAPCGSNIATSAQWLGHFNALADKYRVQCGWDMRSGATADRFAQFIAAHQGLPDPWWYMQNEVRMSKWAQNSAVPIRAFFYVPGHAGALQNAQDDQRRYAQTFAGAFVPIIQMSLPSSRSGKASFLYRVADQAVSDPGDTGSNPGPGPGLVEDFGNIPLTGPTTEIKNVKGMVLQSYSADVASLSVEDTPAPYMQGRHLAVRREGFKITTIGNKRVKGLRLTASYSGNSKGRMGTLCTKPSGQVVSVDVNVSGSGPFTVLCSGKQTTFYFHFLMFDSSDVFRFDNIEIIE